ncbi:MAG: ribosome-associated translation inhibitor RaiA [Elusimicrobia bacterium]|nr:ribosome-associated translation inhibitor RaiA [Elusimicrobiota bacterium]
MQINITARHLNLTEPLADYVRKKVERCERYFDHVAWAQAILSVEKYRQVAEIVIHAGKTIFRSKEESIDLYAAIDLAVDKMDKQLKKHKEISKVHRKEKSLKSKSSKALLQQTGDIFSYGDSANIKNKISEVKRFDVKPVTLGEAISEMDLLGYSFYMFMNADSNQLNVMYRKDNGSLGLIEPEI